MPNFPEKELTALNAVVKRYKLGKQPGIDLELPDVVTARYPETYDNKKKTLLIYGHYDVQPAGDFKSWSTKPFTLQEKDGKLYGRGSTDDKGPVLAWLNALEAYQKSNVEVPVNLIFCFEGMEESGSLGFADFVASAQKDNLFDHVDAACISDNYWLTTNQKTMSDLWTPSGMFGGIVYEPMTDLILLSKLVDSQGTILIPGINALVDDLSQEEISEYANIDFTTRDFHRTIGSKANIYDDVKETLKHRFRYPSLTIHGIACADATPDETTAIPPKVIGKFSIRTVPSMDGNEVTKLTTHYLEQEFKKFGSKNNCKVELFGESAPYWLGSPNDANFKAGKAATKRVYKVDPDLTREGGSIGVTLDLQQALGAGKSIMLLPVGMSDDGAHGTNEKLNKDNYIKGSKLPGAYWWYFANP